MRKYFQENEKRHNDNEKDIIRLKEHIPAM